MAINLFPDEQRLPDDPYNEGPIPPPPVNTPAPAPQPSSSPTDVASSLQSIQSRYGNSVDQSNWAAVQQGRMSLDEFERREQARAAPTSSRQADSQSFEGNQLYGSGTGNATNTPGGAYDGARRPAGPVQQPRIPQPGAQFDDAYSSFLESIAKAQMGEVRSNPALDQLTSFLHSRFGELSQSPGYSPAEMAMLRTQAFEPLEDYRNASKRRAVERAGARGMLPSSGLHELDMRDIETSADRTRTQLDRDFSINAINRRDQDLNQAQSVAQLLGLTIPQGQRNEELGLANLLYQMPRTAMQDAMSIINGSPSSGDALQQALMLLNAQRSQQQYSDQRSMAAFSAIGALLAELFPDGF
jgi:hypothetical protein